MAQTARCPRCTARCVVGATGSCLACGHEQRPGNDRSEPAASIWELTVRSPASLTPDERDRFTDEEAV